MRLRAGPASAVLLGAIGLAAPARAQVVNGKASVALAGSYNQTLTDAPFPTDQTQAGPAVSIAPSGILLIDTPLTTNTLTYAFSLSLPFTREIKLVAAPLQYSHKLTYSGRYNLDEITSMSLGANFSYTPLLTLGGTGDPSQTPVDAIPVGAAASLSAGITEGLSRQLSEAWSLAQATGFTLGAPIDPTMIRSKTISLTNSLTLSKRFTADTLGLAATVGVNYFTAAEGNGGSYTDPATQITDSLTMTWMRPWTEQLTMNVSAGVTQVISPEALTPTSVQPTGSLSFVYRFDITTITASYSHQASPNLASGSVAFTDAATLRFTLPIGSTGLSTSGTGGFTHSEPIGGSGSTTVSSPTNVITSDVALTYKPWFAPMLSASLRGSLQRQVPTDDPTQGFTRLSTSLSLTYSYPNTNAAQTATVIPPALGMTGFTPSDVTASDRIEADAPSEAPPAPETAP